jgi:hypothetical protein
MVLTETRVLEASFQPCDVVLLCVGAGQVMFAWENGRCEAGREFSTLPARVVHKTFMMLFHWDSTAFFAFLFLLFKNKHALKYLKKTWKRCKVN